MSNEENLGKLVSAIMAITDLLKRAQEKGEPIKINFKLTASIPKPRKPKP